LIARDGATSNSLTDLIELPNGCICCTVKDSLVTTLELLIAKKCDLDYIIIECSGLANPGPIASLFWLDTALQSRLHLNGIVTLVDCKHILEQVNTTNEAAQQIAYADRILLNKTDLVESTAEMEYAIRAIHPTAALRATTFSTVPDLEWIMHANSFVDYDLDTEKVPIVMDTRDHGRDPFINGFKLCQETATTHTHTNTVSTISLTGPGSVNLRRMDVWLASILWPNQDEHDNVLRAKLEQEEFAPSENDVSTLQQIYRIKGILSVVLTTDHIEYSTKHTYLETGIDARRFIVQAVYDTWEIHPASDDLQFQTNDERTCKLIVIGRNLDEKVLKEGFRSCFID
jgi:G3E family GTPase